jgi:hypothetical protein
LGRVNKGFRSVREGLKISNERSASKLHNPMRRGDTEEVPSEISSDEWGEVVRYQKVLDQEIR